MLKKSSFWFHNSKFYSNLNNQISENSIEYMSSIKKQSTNDFEFEDVVEKKFLSNEEEEETLHSVNIQEGQSNKKIKIEDQNEPTLNDEFESEEVKQRNLIKFVQNQQEQLCKTNIMTQYVVKPLDVSLSSSASSLSSAFSLLSATSPTVSLQSSQISSLNESDKNSSTASSISLNSDLEIEVASTLVDMKFLGARVQQTK